MGSPVSAVVPTCTWSSSRSLRPRFWKRYVDDTCCIMKEDEAEPLLNHLNSVCPTIKFTMELERDGSLPFLDTKLIRRDGGRGALWM